MSGSFYIAWRYLCHYKSRTLTLVACVTLIATLPLALQLLLSQSERQLSARAEATPLLLGTRGSALDLVMNALYFDDHSPAPVSMETLGEVESMALADAIPLYVRFRARGFAIVGTTMDYFDFRGLKIERGRHLALLGECVLGAEVAARLGIGVGDSLLSSPETVFDIAGVYPLRMRVVGVLERAHSPDDRAVFVDIKTAWVVQGLVHGHEDLSRNQDSRVVIERTASTVVASARLVEYTEITSQNIDSFHFHGPAAAYPLSALVLLPHDAKSGAILRGRYLDGELPHQVVVPETVVDGLLANIFRIVQVLDAVILLVGSATALALILVFALSLRLRQREIHTVFLMGGSRLTIARLLAAEIAIILLASAVLCALALVVVDRFSDRLVEMLFFM